MHNIKFELALQLYTQGKIHSSTQKIIFFETIILGILFKKVTRKPLKISSHANFLHIERKHFVIGVYLWL